YFQEKQYRVAAELLQQEMASAREDTARARKAFLIGESYRLSNAPFQAESFYKQAVDLEYGRQAILQYGRTLKANGKYKEAIEQLTVYQKNYPDEEDVRPDIYGAQLALEWLNNPKNIRVTNLDINSTAFDYAPVLFENGSLLFTSDRSDAQGTETYGWTGEKYSDFFITPRNDNGSFGAVTAFATTINTNYNEGAGSFNKQFTEFYFTRCGSESKFTDFCRLYVSFRDASGTWSDAQLLPFFSEDSVNVQQPFISPSGKELYFVSDSRDGYGEKDIWLSTRTADGWGNPVNLGATVNTPRSEGFPVIGEDGLLYFSSNGHPSMGRFDIFSAKRSGNKWTNVTNLQYPINSSADDFAILFEPVAENERDSIRSKGYFTSSRVGGKGEDDIYRFVQLKIRACAVDVLVQEKILSDTTNPNSSIVGNRPLANAFLAIAELDANGNPVPSAAVVYETNAQGKFRFNALCDKRYRFTASKDNYFSRSDIATTVGISTPDKDTAVANVRITLDRIFREVEINLPNIYYDLAKWNIRPDAALVLDTLVELLKENPSLKVELGSHTDARSDDKYNLNLSQKRAQSAVDYLVSKGIDRKRLTPRGYGETQLVNRCANGVECTEEEHQRNRRTTFKVLGDGINVESQ
ncbi:MAG TPA: OmpA family protein, partial [Chitinophagales bacterium]|nr:OmpA family protein [Chitinophagales bacterium]